MVIQKMADLNGTRWTVQVDNWTWVYEFVLPGVVHWLDNASKKPLAFGHWTLEVNKVPQANKPKANDKIKIWWPSGNTEVWDLPVDTKEGATGKWCPPKGISHGLKAEAVNVVEPVVVPAQKKNVSETYKQDFLNKCDLADTRTNEAEGYLNSFFCHVSKAYYNAYNAHTAFVEKINKAAQLGDELLWSIAIKLVGGIIGETLGSIVQVDKFVVDGIKDLVKYFCESGLKDSVIAKKVAKTPDADYENWKKTFQARASDEMAWVHKSIADWEERELYHYMDFDDMFDPWERVKGFLYCVVPPGNKVSLFNLPHMEEKDEKELQNQLEKVWLEALIRSNKAHSFLDDVYLPPPFDGVPIPDKLLAYGKKLGLANIDALVNEYYPRKPTPLPTKKPIYDPLGA